VPIGIIRAPRLVISSGTERRSHALGQIPCKCLVRFVFPDFAAQERVFENPDTLSPSTHTWLSVTKARGLLRNIL
jgi:hypothetical protein